MPRYLFHIHHGAHVEFDRVGVVFRSVEAAITVLRRHASKSCAMRVGAIASSKSLMTLERCRSPCGLHRASRFECHPGGDEWEMGATSSDRNRNSRRGFTPTRYLYSCGGMRVADRVCLTSADTARTACRDRARLSDNIQASRDALGQTRPAHGTSPQPSTLLQAKKGPDAVVTGEKVQRETQLERFAHCSE
jgi:hypothetical protein